MDKTLGGGGWVDDSVRNGSQEKWNKCGWQVFVVNFWETGLR